MDKHEDASLADEFPEVLVDSRIEVVATAAGTDRQPRHPEFVHAALGLGHRTGPPERDVSQPQQPIRCARNVVGERIVAAPCHLGDKLPVIGRAGEQEGRQRHRVMAHPRVVHFGKAGGDVML